MVFWEPNRIAELAAEGVTVHFGRDRVRAEAPSTRGSTTIARAVRAIRLCRRFLREVWADLVHLNNAPTVGHDDWLPAAGMLGLPIVTHARGAITRPSAGRAPLAAGALRSRDRDQPPRRRRRGGARRLA